MHRTVLPCNSGAWVLRADGRLKRRRELVFDHLVSTNYSRSCNTGMKLVVGTRPVCPPIFCEHWCISRAQLQRYLRLVKAGQREVPESRGGRVVPVESRKRDFIVTWFTQYAAEVTEKLPDCDKILLPRMLWTDLHKQFVSDMQDAGHGEGDIAGRHHFRKTFTVAEELKHMEMTTYKRNFSKCATCVKLTAKVNHAMKSHDAQKLHKAKDERLAHYMLARSDKLHYWQQRWQSRSAVALKLTLIVDKMDSAKNHIPWFSSGRQPKDLDPLLSDALKLHVTGVIIHGRPDARYLFWALPFMPGNANLNLECVRRALVHHLRELSFRPKLYLQFDNASDNKCYATICLFSWLVMEGYVSQVCHPIMQHITQQGGI